MKKLYFFFILLFGCFQNDFMAMDFFDGMLYDCSCTKSTVGYEKVCDSCRVHSADPEQVKAASLRSQFHQDILKRQNKYFDKLSAQINLAQQVNPPIQAKNSAAINLKKIDPLIILAKKSIVKKIRDDLDLDELQELGRILYFLPADAYRSFDISIIHAFARAVLDSQIATDKIESTLKKPIAQYLIDRYYVPALENCSCYYSAGFFNECIYCALLHGDNPSLKCSARKRLEEKTLFSSIGSSLAFECLAILTERENRSDGDELLLQKLKELFA